MSRPDVNLASFSEVPVIDVSPLVAKSDQAEKTAAEIGRACRESGFFYVVGHGVPAELCERLESLARQFFAQDLATKMQISMDRGGRAWRGYFPVGNELTSGKPDLKEGIYFGSELDANDPRVRAAKPLHGPNLFPDLTGFRETVLEYLNALTTLGHVLMSGIALSLNLPASYFRDHYTHDPLILFRIFNYPAPKSLTAASDSPWGVGEHTDYGLLTILLQDAVGGLQVKSRSQWVDAAPIPGSFICNIGDMLDRMTRGLYRSTPHRVRNVAQRDRLSFPFFFDPNFDAEIHPVPLPGDLQFEDDRQQRWDQSSVHEFRGTYGDYLLNKVAKVFPELRKEVL